MTYSRFVPLIVALFVSSTVRIQAAMILKIDDITRNGQSFGLGFSPNEVIVSPGSSGDVIAFHVYAEVTGDPSNGGVEGFQGAIFSLESSTNGGILGNFGASGFTLNPDFTGPSSGSGIAQDVDGDGDLDIGGTATNSLSGYIYARSTIMLNNGTPIADGLRFHLGSAALTITSALSNSIITVNPVIPAFTGANGVINNSLRASFTQDGIVKTGQTGTLGVGAPLIITTMPEPSSGFLLAIAAVGGLAWRRRTRFASRSQS